MATANPGLLEEFTAITGCTNEEAVHFLDACQGDLKAAVDLCLSARKTPPLENGDVRAPIPQVSGVLVNESFHSSYAPKYRRRPTDSVFDSMRDPRVEMGSQRGNRAGSSAASDRLADAKRRNLEVMFRPPIDITFKGGFESAKDFACRNKKWLLVNIQNVTEFQCQVFNRDVWSNSAIKELVRTNFVLWQVYMDTADGRRFSTFYHVKHWPFLAILDPNTGELLVQIKSCDAMAVCEALTGFLEKYPNVDCYKAALPSSAKIVAMPASSSGSATNGYNHEVSLGKRKSLESSQNMHSKQKMPRVDHDANSGIHEIDGASMPTFDELATASSENYTQFISSDEPLIHLQFRFPNDTRQRLTLGASSLLKAVHLFAAKHGCPVQSHELKLNFPPRDLSILNPNLTLVQLCFNRQETIWACAKD